MSLRLLKVVVQPVLVEDDGDTLTEQIAEAVHVSAADWPDYPARLAAELEQLNEGAAVN